MSSRARRVSATAVTPFNWGGPAGLPAEMPPPPTPAEQQQAEDHSLREAQLAMLEREAFARGFEQGERAGAEAAGERTEAMLRRLMETLEELQTLRAEMIRQTERQMVQLALAMARRVVHREVSIDQDLLIAMARVAIDRLGESAQVKVRLNPDDYEAAGAHRVAQMAGSNVLVLADAHVSRGGCRVESDMGVADIGVDAQLQEIARALLGDDVMQGAEVTVGTGQRSEVAVRRQVDA